MLSKTYQPYLDAIRERSEELAQWCEALPSDIPRTVQGKIVFAIYRQLFDFDHPMRTVEDMRAAVEANEFLSLPNFGKTSHRYLQHLLGVSKVRDLCPHCGRPMPAKS